MTVKEALKNCAVFAGLTGEEMEQVAALAVPREYEAGATIFQEGDAAGELFVLLDGKVAIQIPLPAGPAPGSRRITVDIASGNEVFGPSAVVPPHTYALTAVCLKKASVLSINGSQLRALFKQNYHLGYEVLLGLCQVVAARLDDTRQILISERAAPSNTA